jgi:hypothetical protein
MDVPCPKYNSTDLQKISLACEEVLHRCDKREQLQAILLGSGGQGVLVGASTRKGARPATLTARSGGVGACRIRGNTSPHLLSFETFIFKIRVATAASNSLLAARQQASVAGITFRAVS